MGWQDRDYYREGRGGNDYVARVLAFFNSTYPLGTYRGIRVSFHITLIFAFVALFLFAHNVRPDGSIPSMYACFLWTTRMMTLVFLCVIAHEFGHALACRAVGGICDQIVIWPLGGLAFCAPPRRALPEFITVFCGPLVNIVLALVAFLGLRMHYGWDEAYSHVNYNFLFAVDPTTTGFHGFLIDLFLVNFSNALFNLCLAFYPFDSGQMIQILLSVKLGYTRSMRISTAIGMVVAVGVGIFGLYNNQMLLIGVAIFGFYACYNKGRELEQTGDLDELEYEAAQARKLRAAANKKNWIETWRERRQLARIKRERESLTKLNQEVDLILDKVRDKGLQSLSKAEKAKLQEATDRQRKAV